MLTCAKMNGNGNDFLVINNMNLKYDSAVLSDYALKLCRRRESLGADGILALEPSEAAEFKMRLFNRDGSEGEMCGNGARCIARYAFEKGIAQKNEMCFETLGGKVNANVKGSRVTLKLAPVSLKDAVIDAPATVNGVDFNYTFLTVGVPHTVIFSRKRKMTNEEYTLFGRAVRNRTDLFPEGTNVNFAVPREGLDGGLDVITYERGVEDLTLSCGTGSTASAIAAVLIGITGPNVNVWNPGGLNRVSLQFPSADTVLPELEGGALYIADIQAAEDAFENH